MPIAVLKIKFIVSFIIMFPTLSFPIGVLLLQFVVSMQQESKTKIPVDTCRRTDRQTDKRKDGRKDNM